MESTAAADPKVGSSRLLLGTLGVVACHAFAIAALVVAFVLPFQRLVATMKDRDLELPAMTIAVINFGNWLTDYWYLLAVLLVPDGLAYFGLSRLSRKWNWLATVWALVWLLATILLLVFLIVAWELTSVPIGEGTTTAP